VFGRAAENDLPIVTRSVSEEGITDGQVAGEDAIPAAWAKCEPSRRPRIYCLGIDRAVNASVLQRLCTRTGGVCELVESERRLDEVLGRFTTELGGHVLDRIRIHANDGQIESATLAPQRRLTLYADRPLTLYGRTRCGSGSLSLTITGERADGSAWEQPLAATTSAAALLPLWGRQRVRELEDDFICGGSTDPQLRQQIVSCSLEARVLSRFTAYVAIDRSERVNESETVAQVVQPAEFPEGWEHAAAAGAAALRARSTRRSLKPVPMSPSVVAVDPNLIEQIPEAVARENCVVPVRQDGAALIVGMADPGDSETIEKLRFILNRPIVPEFAPRESILGAIDAAYGRVEDENADSILQCFTSEDLLLAPVSDTADSMLQEFTDTAIDFTETFVSSDEAQLTETSAPIVRLVQLLIAEAVQLRASHILIEPHADQTAVHYAIDGCCYPRDMPPRRLHQAIVHRLKTLSHLELTPNNRLQSGTIQVSLGEKSLDLEVFFIPGDHGESILVHFAGAVDQQKSAAEAKRRTADLAQHDATIIPRLVERAERCAKGGDPDQQRILSRLRSAATRASLILEGTTHEHRLQLADDKCL